MTFIYQRSIQHQGGLNQSCQADSLGGFRIHKLEKIVGGRKGIKKYPAQQWKCVLHIRSTVKLDTCVKFCIVLLLKGSCFEKYQSVKNY